MSKDIVSKIITGLIILAVLFFGLKGCVVTIWSSPKSPEIYSVLGTDGRSMSVTFLQSRTMICTLNPSKDHFEGVLTEMKGSMEHISFCAYGTLTDRVLSFGYRIYPSDAEPVTMEITILERIWKAVVIQPFQTKGTRTYDVMLFSKDAVRFHDMWLKRDALTILNILI